MRWTMLRTTRSGPVSNALTARMVSLRCAETALGSEFDFETWVRFDLFDNGIILVYEVSYCATPAND